MNAMTVEVNRNVQLSWQKEYVDEYGCKNITGKSKVG